MKKIKVALLGIGNCASSLVQGVYYYSDPSRRARGLIHPLIGGHAPSDLSFVLAIDTDARKVGRDLADAIFAPPSALIDDTRKSVEKMKERGKEQERVIEDIKRQAK